MIKLQANQKIIDINGNEYLTEEGDSLEEARRNLPVSSKQTPKKMDNDVYKLRRQVMKYIYRAKDLLGGDMPRIDVRITDITPERLRMVDTHGYPLGQGPFKQNYIMIPETTLTKYPEYLHEIVFHELLHTIYGIQHDENSPLMSNKIGRKPLTEKESDYWFVKHAKEANLNESLTMNSNKINDDTLPSLILKMKGEHLSTIINSILHSDIVNDLGQQSIDLLNSLV